MYTAISRKSTCLKAETIQVAGIGVLSSRRKSLRRPEDEALKAVMLIGVCQGFEGEAHGLFHVLRQSERTTASVFRQRSSCDKASNHHQTFDAHLVFERPTNARACTLARQGSGKEGTTSATLKLHN